MPVLLTREVPFAGDNSVTTLAATSHAAIRPMLWNQEDNNTQSHTHLEVGASSEASISSPVASPTGFFHWGVLSPVQCGQVS